MKNDNMVPMIEQMAASRILVNGKEFDNTYYSTYHHQRIAYTMAKLLQIGARKIVEVGGHPWAMTAQIIDSDQLELLATISAEEVTKWPDDIGVKTQTYHIRTPRGEEACFINYSANIERTPFDIQERPDTIIACEIVEHFIRSPHIMFLNINRWLPQAGKLLITTPNGSQFANPFRRKSPTPAYRANLYERHSFLYTLDQLKELVTLCGFKIIDAGYLNVYQVHGLPRLYQMLSKIPLAYFQEKFKKMIYLIAQKEKDTVELEKTPSIYIPSDNWDFIKSTAEHR